MSEISTITQGMTLGQMVGIINQLIVAFNERSGALDNCLTDGKIDYNRLVNRPKINNVTLEGAMSSDNLSITIDQATRDALSLLADRLQVCEEFQDDAAPRIQTLEGYKERVETLEGYKTRVETLENYRQTDRADIDTLNGYKTRVESLERTSTTEYATRQSLLDSMTQDVQAAHSSAQQAQSSASSLSGMDTRLKSLETTVGDATEGMKKTVDELAVKINDAQTGMDYRLKESRSKINETLDALKRGDGKIDDVVALVGGLLEK